MKITGGDGKQLRSVALAIEPGDAERVMKRLEDAFAYAERYHEEYQVPLIVVLFADSEPEDEFRLPIH
jgi:hypothetical protein